MRIYFSDNDNLQILNNHFEILYITTVTKFEERLKLYKLEKGSEKGSEKLSDKEYVILINELEETLKTLNDNDFKTFFLDLGTETLEKIRYISVSKHTDKCTIRAVFDILFKYLIDFEFKVSYSCCDSAAFKSLQIEILKDLRWRINVLTNKSIIQSPIQIRNQIQNLKI